MQLHFLEVSSHFIVAFSQSALFSGGRLRCGPLANAVPVEAHARPNATIIETRLFMMLLLLMGLLDKNRHATAAQGVNSTP
jgi:hypothetical protein